MKLLMLVVANMFEIIIEKLCTIQRQSNVLVAFGLERCLHVKGCRISGVLLD